MVSGEPLFCHQNWSSHTHTTFGEAVLMRHSYCVILVPLYPYNIITLLAIWQLATSSKRILRLQSNCKTSRSWWHPVRIGHIISLCSSCKVNDSLCSSKSICVDLKLDKTTMKDLRTLCLSMACVWWTRKSLEEI